jgi:hypothetical protein
MGDNFSFSMTKRQVLLLSGAAIVALSISGILFFVVHRTDQPKPSATAATSPSIVNSPLETRHLLTIAPVPIGGTLQGVDLICGSKGSVCSAEYAESVPVNLHPTPDPGFTFVGFLGDCAPLGHTEMTGPRTCSGTFSSDAVVARAAPPPPAGAPRIPPEPAQRPPANAARGGSRESGVNAPDRPPSPDIFQPVQDYIARMKEARAGFSVEKEMIVGQPYIVRLQLSPRLSTQELRSQLDRQARTDHPSVNVPPAAARIETKAEPVKYGPHMVGHISASGCTIEALRPEDQVVPPDSEAEWAWQLTPQKSQKLKVTVRLEAVVDGSPILIRVFDGEVEVRATLRQRVTTFVGGNWQWLWTTIAAPLAAYWLATLRNRRKGRTKKKRR